MHTKLTGWEEKNKKIWKEIIPKRFSQPEVINQDFGITFGAVLQEYIQKNPIDPEHVHLVNFELVPQEVKV